VSFFTEAGLRKVLNIGRFRGRFLPYRASD
jgi:hypothetical protein